MKVTIEGVVNSDVCERGARHTVEWTEYLRGLVRSGLVQVVEWHHPEPESLVVVEDTPPVVDDPPAPKRPRRPRRTQTAEE